MTKENRVSAQVKYRVLFAVVMGLLASASVQAATKVYYIHNDHLGTPQVMTDASQTVVWKADYQPFGEAGVDEDPDGDGVAVEMPLRFPGQYYDREMGLHYNYYRDYDPSTGRYVQSDPIGLRGGINTYIYVEGNPNRYVDPDGLRRVNPWNIFQQYYGGRGLTKSQMLNIYRQLKLNGLGGPSNRELHENLENLPDGTEKALNDMKCGSSGVCTIEIKRCECFGEDDLGFCPVGPQIKAMSEDDPNCYCWTEIVRVYL